jgi:uncharacterized membrane protein YbaN (DUF454 family)
MLNRANLKHVLMLSLGWFFVLLGIAGLVLPFLQGILFLAIGFGILARHSEWARRLLERLRRRYPQYAQTFDRAAERAEGSLQRSTQWFRDRLRPPWLRDKTGMQ